MTLPIPGLEGPGDPAGRAAPLPKPPELLPVAPIGFVRAKQAQCRSCSRPIVFVITVKKRGGREVTSNMPVDVDPEPGGNVLVTRDGRRLRGYVLPRAKTAGRADLRTSHFQTCPEADQWRTR